MADIVNLGEATNDSSKVSVEQALEIALRDLRAGRVRANACVVVLVDQGENHYHTNLVVAQQSPTGVVLALEYAKAFMLRRMMAQYT